MPSAVPEADTYAMLLAGMGLMGVIARRRRQA
ncbi:MAG TPA: PEP-CTERM sorting domain-containing protein [Duganella sp.]